MAAGYRDSEDGACRLPLAPGFSIRPRVVRGEAFYDPQANHIFRRPDQEYYDFCRGTRPIAVLKQLNAGVFSRETATPESALTRVASDYLQQEVLEDGTYFAAVPDQVSTVGGISQVSTILRNGSGENKQLTYSVEYLQQASCPVLILTAKERLADDSETCHGFVAKCFGDKIVAGYARFLLQDKATEADLQAIAASIAGIQVQEPLSNPQLEKAVVGTWEASGAARPTEARYVFGPDGRFARMLYLHGDSLRRGQSEPGDYRIYGNLISLRYDKDQAVSFPVKLEGDRLNLGGRQYARVAR